MRRNIRQRGYLWAAVAMTALCLNASALESGFISLFNGKNLDGWIMQGMEKAKPKIEDGVMKAGGWDYWGVITEKEYQNFIFRFDVKFEDIDGKRSNSGVLIHTGKKEIYKTSFEIQLAGDYGKNPTKKSTGAIFGKKAPSVNATKPIGEWNAVEIKYIEPKIWVTINGKTVQDGVDLSKIKGLKHKLKKGRIAFQRDDYKKAATYYKNIRIKKLSDATAAATQEAAKVKPYREKSIVVAGKGRPHRTDWFKKAGWGVFVHYLASVVAKGDATSVTEWNRVVDSTDVEGLANQLASMGAGYCVITLGQNSGHFCAPNPTYDRITGIKPSKCAKRDLVADLYRALKPKGIRLITYLPAGAPDRDDAAMKALEWKNGKYPLWSHPKGGPDGGDDRLVNFQRKWEAVIRDWSERWGDRVSGWWFDGCYFPIAMYQHPDPPNFASFAKAARAGNPNSIVAFNPGVRHPIICLTPNEDYTAGEVNEPTKVVCKGRWVDKAQFHTLSYLGDRWGHGEPRFTNKQIAEWTRAILDKQGVVTWEVPILPTGLIPQPFVDQLSALNKALK